mmetsp:Transcript_19609/g.47083  ORF Transcript_19609/g.47083 Transcript_19609/m.47083 type:complete len:118 (+) Transcript_19609:774-1127(+)
MANNANPNFIARNSPADPSSRDRPVNNASTKDATTVAAGESHRHVNPGSNAPNTTTVTEVSPMYLSRRLRDVPGSESPQNSVPSRKAVDCSFPIPMTNVSIITIVAVRSGGTKATEV